MLKIKSGIDCFISTVVAVFSSIFGELWFLFAFLLGLNILDYITGIMKARYLRIESSRMAFKGFSKTLYTWVLIAVGFGLSFMFIEVGHYFDMNLNFMVCIGWFMLAHCIINEVRSILENIVQLDKGNYIPNWLIRGLQVTQDLIDKKANDFVDKIQDGLNKEDKNDNTKINSTQQ